MTSPEVFYLHIQGEQRGPYTVQQIDHLLNSRLIPEETLYWCEGLDQWQPVTTLVKLRQPRRSWKKLAALGALLLLFAALGKIFGPVMADGWREVNQHSGTGEAAYWRAREVVRSGLPAGRTIVEFGPFSSAQVVLAPEAEKENFTHAAVHLRGDWTDREGHLHPAAWKVPMVYDRRKLEWSGGPPIEEPLPNLSLHAP